MGLLLVYCLFVALASIAGGWLPSLVRLTHRRMQLMISVVAGLMLGVAMFHLLPHAVVHLESIDEAVGWAMGGLLSMFFLIRCFHFHSHSLEDDHQHDEHEHEHDPNCGHAHHDHRHHPHAISGFSWVGVALGLSLHTLIDGAALAASVAADLESGDGVALAGLATFLAVALHKPLDSLSITTLMAAQGWSHRAQQRINLAYALACPLGAFLFMWGVGHLGDASNMVLGAALAFSAGVFLCISLADLLPEIEYHSHDRVILSTALLAGVLLAYAIGYLEPAHAHDAHVTPGSGHHGHSHSH
jgi:zinc and cadmium transporter